MQRLFRPFTAICKLNNGLKVEIVGCRRLCSKNDGKEETVSANNPVDDKVETATEEKTVKISQFAQKFIEHEALVNRPAETEEPLKPKSFATLMRNSKLVDLGDPLGKVVPGVIFRVIRDDLYIDFGGKFHCVCQKPVKNSENYVRGARVRVRVKELELSTRFLGSVTDLTLLEADCDLIALTSTPYNAGDESHTRPARQNQAKTTL